MTGLTLTASEVQYFISNDSTIACVGEIDEMVPRGQDVSDTKRKYSKVAGQDYIMLEEILRQTDFRPDEIYQHLPSPITPNQL